LGQLRFRNMALERRVKALLGGSQLTFWRVYILH
jgi:hypothetical protein